MRRGWKDRLIALVLRSFEKVRMSSQALRRSKFVNLLSRKAFEALIQP